MVSTGLARSRTGHPVCALRRLAYSAANDTGEDEMPALTFTPPRQWQDWISWGLGFWLLISPWALHFSGEAEATYNAVLVGFALIFAEGVTLSVFQVWEEWINITLGIWLCLSPWLLGGFSAIATANALLIGALVVALAVYEMWQVGEERV
jgi:SPW repeat